jgi:hypothetical protein
MRPSGGAGIFARVQLTQESDDARPRGGKLRGDHVPHEIEIDTEVVVDKLVPHACHLTPRHTRRSLSQIRRHPLCGLADNLKIPHNGVLDN